MSAWRARIGGAAPITRFGYAELINAIALGQFRGELTTVDCVGAIEDTRVDLALGRLRLVDVFWRATLDRAAELSGKYVPQIGARALDVLHVASALGLGVRQFVTYDERQARLAEACGLKVVRP
jgi:predicted nucleic acid-binding protein